MKNFTNSILLPNDLPTLEEKAFNLLDRKYLKLVLIWIAFIFVFLGACFTAFIFLSDGEIPRAVILTIVAILFVLFIYAVLINVLGFSRKGYLLRENDISFKKGIITYKQTTIPFNRIQHVEVNQGVMAKCFKLSSLKLYTAGGNASDLSIPGIPRETAQNLKAFLSEKISEHE